MSAEGEQPVTEKIEDLKNQLAIIKEKLGANPNIASLESVATARAKANAELKKLKGKFPDLGDDNLVIGGKRTKRSKPNNRKTKNKRKKPHKRN